MYKKRIILLIFTIAIYLVISYIFSKTQKNSLKEVYVVKENIKKGEVFDSNNITKVNVDTNTLDNDFKYSVTEVVAKADLKIGQILTNDIVIKKEDYNSIDDNKELVTIDLDTSSKNTFTNIQKDNYINVYYTARTNQVESFFKSEEYEKIKSQSITESYMTVLLFKDIKVLDVYDKSGNKIKDENNYTGAIKIVLEIDSQKVLLLENLKNYGTFRVTIKR